MFHNFEAYRFCFEHWNVPNADAEMIYCLLDKRILQKNKKIENPQFDLRSSM